MKITGELLRSERLKKNITVQDVAQALKLSVRTITAIEEADLTELPSKTFVRGFVKSYSDYLKLDTAYVMNLFHEEMGTTKPIPKVEHIEINNRKSPSRPSENAIKKPKKNDTKAASDKIETVSFNLKNTFNRKTVLTMALIFIVIITIAIINSFISRYQNEVSPIATIELGQPDVQTQEQSALPRPEEFNNIQEMTTYKFIEPLVSKEKPVSEHPKEVAADKTENPATVETADFKTENIETKETSENEPVDSKKSIEIVLEALKDTVISYSKGQDTNFQSFELKESTFQIIRSNSGLKLKIQNGNAVQITVNGVNKGLASPNDSPVQISY